MPAVEEDTTVLDELDFPLTCLVAPAPESTDLCGEIATHVLVCTSCEKNTGYVCADHAVLIRQMTAMRRHRACGAQFPMRDLVRVVPL